jgi:hypothetical protein
LRPLPKSKGYVSLSHKNKPQATAGMISLTFDHLREIHYTLTELF